MKLTTTNLDTVFRDCLFKEGEDTSNHVVGKGIMRDFGFHPERLASHADDIQTMLDELPDDFREGKGGGMSFLNACVTRDGEQWGEHQNMEQLFALGTASGKASLLMPRAMWDALPGGMPYYSIRASSIVPQPGVAA